LAVGVGLSDGLLGGAGGASLGSMLSNGLNDLLKQFQANGQGDKAQSWLNNGPNKPVSPQELAQALGEGEPSLAMKRAVGEHAQQSHSDWRHAAATLAWLGT
jgi:uncharacterized protein YidB (DUF937 family)